MLPPYKPGDVLWVRETWNIIALCDECNDTQACFAYKASEMPEHDCRWASITWGNYEKYIGNVCPDLDRWRPSIHMPKEAARLFLRVTGVRIEKLQDILPMDVKAEGIKIDEDDEFSVECSPEAMERFKFEVLWNGTVKPANLPHYGWDANPWVWVIEFERVGKP